MRGWMSGRVCRLLVTMFLAMPAAHADDEKSLILCGDRIGQIHVGRDDEPMEKWLGEPSTSSAATGGKGADTWLSKSPDGRVQEPTISTLYADPNRKNPPRPRVEMITVTSPFFHTPDGNSTRSNPVAFWREFPDLRFLETQEGMDGSHLQLYDDTRSGLALLIEPFPSAAPGKPWGKCRAIIVHRAGQEPGFVNIGEPPKPKTGV